ncbi:MAG: FAD-binding oxidoreductase [Myxococcales bacterium]|nr:FAD-binding oxidoreductase [Myxococcales bacterium]
MNALTEDLARIVGREAVSTEEPERRAYAHDLWPKHLIAKRAGRALSSGPRAVVWPSSDAHVGALLRYAKRAGVKIAPFGAGSGVCGMTEADADTIVLDTKRMRSVRALDVPRGRALIDAGMLGQHLEDELLARGATLGHYPSSISCSTLGGWIVTRGAGQCSGRYGKIEDMVLGLEGVMPDGEPFAAGVPREGEPDARALFVGSEGLFGVVTRAHMRVWPAPTERRYLAYTFATLRQAWDAVRSLYQSGIRPAVCRVYDPFDTYVFRTGQRRSASKSAHKIERDPAAKHPVEEWLLRRTMPASKAINALNFAFGERVFGRSLLILLFERAPNEPVDESVSRARRTCLSCGGRDEGEAPARRWLERRHSVSYRQPGTYAKGLWVDTMEVAAPWACFQALYEGVRGALAEGGFVMAHMSHAYPDGCSIYFTFVGASPDDERALENYTRTWSRALEAAHNAGGTIAHHHGVGRSKRQAMRLEHGAGVDVIASLSRAADRDGVLAGGPLLPARGEGPAAPSITVSSRDVSIDAMSRLVTARPSCALADVHRALEAQGLALRGAPIEGSVGEWLARVPSAQVLRDPVDHRVAGYVARTASGARAHLLPAPRRAAGPELFTLFATRPERFGAIETVTLVAHAKDRQPEYTAPFEEPELATTDNVRAWIDRAAG